MSKQWLAVLSVATALAWTVPTEAKQGRGHGKAKAEKHEDKAEKQEDKAEKHENKAEKHEKAEKHGRAARRVAPRVIAPVVVIDRDGHRRIVTQYYTRESLPPGLARREALPPGLQRQLRERGRLPPGLQKRLVIVPGPLLSQLPPVPPYYTRYFAGRDLVVVDTRTNTIVNVIRDVLAR